MTNKEALISLIDFTLPEGKITKALIDSDIDGDAIYSSADERIIDLAMAGLLISYVSAKKITEGDWSIEMPSRADLISLISFLYRKHKLKDPYAPAKPSVRAVKAW